MYARKSFGRRPILPLILLILLTMTVLAACQNSRSQPAEQAVAAEEPAAAATEATASEEPAAEEPAEAEAAPEVDAAPAANQRTFTLSEGTEARFLIDEVLMGQDKTVVGTTSLATGEIRLDPANPSGSEITTITIDASDLTTDSDRRNGAIRRFILNTDSYQYITFEPTAIEGLPDAVSVGEPFSFTVTGNLSIRDVTQPVTFDVTVTAESEDTITGMAKTSVLRADFGLTIPQVPNVTDVQDEVFLELEFQATAQ